MFAHVSSPGLESTFAIKHQWFRDHSMRAVILDGSAFVAYFHADMDAAPDSLRNISSRLFIPLISRLPLRITLARALVG